MLQQDSETEVPFKCFGQSSGDASSKLWTQHAS